MKNIIRDYPIGGIALLLLACVKFEYHSQSSGWSISSPGLVGGVAVLAIIVAFLLFRIFNAAQDACISRGLLRSRIRSKYDLLIPVAIILVAVQARWFGTPMLLENGKAGYQWEFTWSDPNWAIPFVGALVGVVLLIRVLSLFRAIAHESTAKANHSLQPSPIILIGRLSRLTS